jgi:predicted CoA-binding protein
MSDPVADLLKRAKTIAVIGCSKNPEKDAHTVPAYMIEKGYRVLPVNPTADEIFGRKVYKSILEVTEPVDIVDVFRPGPECDKVVEEALKVHPKAIWLQLGITNARAKELAKAAGVEYIEDRCLRVEHKRVFGWS